MSEKVPTFRQGKTHFEGSPTNATDGDYLLGHEVILRDRFRNQSRVRVLRAVRNSAGFALLAKRAVKLSADGRTATGYGLDGESNWAVVDERLPTGGVATNDIFWVTMRGPTLALTALSNYSADLAAGDILSLITAATSGATTGGRVKLRPVVAATADATAGQRNMTENDAGRARAISGCSTNSTNNDLLIDMRPF